MNKGEIFIGRQTTHPIIFIKPKNESEFLGIILTHSHIKTISDNIHLKQEHFDVYDEAGKKYPVQYDNTLIPKQRIINKNDWGPFKKAGNLTSTGNGFMEDHFDELEPVKWGELSGKSKY